MSTKSSISLTHGSLFAGVVVASTLYGLTVLQTTYYYISYPKDGKWLKAFVAFVWVFDTLHLVLICITTADTMIFRNGASWAGSGEVVASGILSVIVQTFYLYRIWILSKHNRALCCSLSLGILAYLGTVILYVVKTTTDGTYDRAGDNATTAIIANSLGAGVDVFISASLIALLSTRRRGFHERTDQMLLRLTVMTMTTGFWTALCAIMVVIMAAVLPDALLYAAFFFIMSKLYTNMLLATLNARQLITDGALNGPSAFATSAIGPISADGLSNRPQTAVHIPKPVGQESVEPIGVEITATSSRVSSELNNWKN